MNDTALTPHIRTLPAGQRPQLICPTCRKVIFDGLILRGRVLRVRTDDAVEVKCQCKHWVDVPLRYVDTQ